MSRGFGRVRCSCHSPIPPVTPQADFGEAMAVIGGALRKIHFLAFDLPHSDGCFVAAYPAETTEAFCDGHNGGVCLLRRRPPDPSCTTTPSWRLPGSWAMGSGSERASSRSFSPTICSRTGSAGRARATTRARSRGLVGFIRRNFLVPVPRAESFAALNDALAEQCRRRQAARLRGHKETIGERLERDRQVLLPLPPCSL